MLQTLEYKRAGELAIHADLRLARGDARAPLLVLLHSGGLIAGGRRWFAQYALDEFRRAGFATLAIDHRLAPRTRGPEIVSDVRDAIAWATQKLPDLFPIDPERIALVGYSAGAYLAHLLGCWDDGPRPRAVVSYYGYGDILGDWYAFPSEHYGGMPAIAREQALRSAGASEISDGSADPKRLDFYLYCRQQGRWLEEVFGMDREADADELRRYCPIHRIDAGAPPTLLLHGDADQDVPVSESVAMNEALAASGAQSEMIVVPGGAHGFDLPWLIRRGAERPSSLLVRLGRPLAGLLPSTTFRGGPPKGSEVFMGPTLAFLGEHLRP